MARPMEWTCFCGRINGKRQKVCPECGRDRKFVLTRQKAENLWDTPQEREDASSRQASGHLEGAAALLQELSRGGLLSPLGKFAGRYPRLRKWTVSVVLLLVIYWVAVRVGYYVTQPPLVMTTSPLAGRVAVTVEPAKLEPIASSVTYTGSVAPWEEVSVLARHEGWLEKFGLYEGDIVRKGQVIALLDQAEIKAQVSSDRAALVEQQRFRDEAKASLEVARANLLDAQAGLAAARADLDFWTKEAQRAAVLVKEKALAQVGYDDTVNQLAAARSRLEAQQAKIAMHQAKLRETEARIKRLDASVLNAQAKLDRVRTVLSYTEVTAPISGVVAKRHVYAGQLVKRGSPLVDIQDISKIRVQVKVAEKDLPLIHEGTKAVVRFPALAGSRPQFTAKVSTVFPQLDPITRTSTVELTLPNEDGRIKADMYAIVRLVLQDKERALTVSRRAIIEVDGKPTIFTTDSVVATAVPVEIGIVQDSRAEVLEGIKEGDLVIVQGNRGLVDRQEITLVSGF